MVQSWNKFCFQGGYIEYAMMMPEHPYSQGYWPGSWIMGNLGRPGYLGTTDGMWPYSYVSPFPLRDALLKRPVPLTYILYFWLLLLPRYSNCDTGILANQTFLNKTGPYEALHSKGQWAKKGVLSYLEGMRAPSCTCPDEDHPGPHPSVARSAPEIDVIEGTSPLSLHR